MVVVVGLAETGVAVARRLRADGNDVTVLEDAPAPSARYRERVEIVRGAGAELIEQPDDATARAIVARSELVVPSPLVRPDHVVVRAARELGVPVQSEIDIAAERAGAPIVAITGTNGKTTVTSMIAAMLDASDVRATAAGNIGRPLIDAISDDVEVIVAEVSSFQLEFTTTFRPRVAVLLAITPDHLDWHGSFDAYVAAKARITAQQESTDVLVYDADDPRACKIAQSSAARTIAVSVRADAAELTLADGTVIAPVRALRRALLHDRTNALTAAAAALEVGATPDGVRATLASYETMRHRVALVGEHSGVQWFDDSKATNPDATVRAVASFEHVVLLAGGRNKGLDLRVLATSAPRLRAVVAFGEAAPEVVAAFDGVPGPAVKSVTTMHDAVAAARAFAQPGDVVLLSPACASFDAYDNYAQRGDDFAAEFRAQVGEEAPAR